MAKTEQIELLVEQGKLIPATKRAAILLREHGLKVGDIVTCTIRKERNPRFHRMVHAIARMCSESIEDFGGMEPHDIIKQVQLRGRIEVEETLYHLPGVGDMINIKPKSISFATMGEDCFQELALKMCRWIAITYFPNMQPQDVLKLAENFINE